MVLFSDKDNEKKRHKRDGWTPSKSGILNAQFADEEETEAVLNVLIISLPSETSSRSQTALLERIVRFQHVGPSTRSHSRSH